MKVDHVSFRMVCAFIALTVILCGLAQISLAEQNDGGLSLVERLNRPKVTAVPLEGEAELLLYATEDPVCPIVEENGQAIWFYTVELLMKNNSQFTVTEIVEEVVDGNGFVADVRSFSTEQLCWGDGQLTHEEPLAYNGGFPVQNISRIDVTVRGKDACDEEHELVCQVNFSLGDLLDSAEEAELSLYATEEPVYPTIVQDERADWFYSVQLEMANQSVFTVTELVQEMVDLNGHVVEKRTFTPEDLRWGNGVLVSGGRMGFNGRCPVQDFSRIEITVHGTDACSEKHEAKCQVNLSKEMK